MLSITLYWPLSGWFCKFINAFVFPDPWLAIFNIMYGLSGIYRQFGLCSVWFSFVILSILYNDIIFLYVIKIIQHENILYFFFVNECFGVKKKWKGHLKSCHFILFQLQNHTLSTLIALICHWDPSGQLKISRQSIQDFFKDFKGFNIK